MTDRLLAAGYPLSGDLSLGGLRSENIASGGESSTAQSVVNGWTGDAPHLSTMISPSLTEIGAGVAIASGRVYYVIDCALARTSAASQASTSASAILPTVTIAPTAAVESSLSGTDSVMIIALSIIVLALLGGGVFTWIGRKRKE